MNKNSFRLNQAPKWMGSLIIALVLFWLLVGVKVLNPQFIGWLGSDNDPAQHYLGWIFFRQSPWTFPLGLNPEFGLDIGSSIVYSDSIPLLAFIFKILSKTLPSDFQYFGIWTLVCFIFQALFSWKLVGLVTESPQLRLLSIPFFVCSPILLNRIGIHAALTGQFLILAALFLCLTPNQKNRVRNWSLLLAISACTHFYLLVIILGIWIASYITTLTNQRIAYRHLIIEITISSAVLGLTMWQAGYFTVGLTSAGGGWGYGTWGMNILSFFNAKGWSYILPPIPGVESHQDRFQYPGLGVLLLLFLALCKFKTLQHLLSHAIQKWLWLFLIMIFFTIFAISDHIGIGSFRLSINLPAPLLVFGNALRASDRFFWPVAYLITLASISCVIRGYRAQTAALILFTASLIQILDTKAGWGALHQRLNTDAVLQETADLIDPFWVTASKHYKNIILTPAQNSPDHWRTFGFYAANHHMGTTAAYLARIDSKKLEKLQTTIINGEIRPGTLYLLDERTTPFMLSRLNFSHDLLAEVNGYRVLAPGWRDCRECTQSLNKIDPRDLFSPTFINKPIIFTKEADIDKQLLLNGWSKYIEDWGVWSDGGESQLVLPLPRSGSPKTLTLQMRAHISPGHPEQIVRLWVNGAKGPEIILRSFDSNTVDIAIPAIATQQGYISLKLIYPNANSPRQANASTDDRLLSIGLKSALFR